MRRAGQAVPNWEDDAVAMCSSDHSLASGVHLCFLRPVFFVLRIGFAWAPFFRPDLAFFSSRNFHAVCNAPANTSSSAPASRT